jgi:hypothetical protein
MIGHDKWKVKNWNFIKNQKNKLKSNLSSQATKHHNNKGKTWTRELIKRKFLTKAGPSVRVLWAETRLTVYLSLLVKILPLAVGLSGRACMYKIEGFSEIWRSFTNECACESLIQCFYILRLRCEIVNALNDRTDKKLYPRQSVQKLNIWGVKYWIFWKIIK